MKWFIIISFLFFSNSILSQESKFKVIGEQKISDSMVIQTAELMIFNDRANPICIIVSYEFGGGILSRDTIELAPLKLNSSCFRYDLWVSSHDLRMGLNNIPRYPLVINPKTCFVATISLLRNLRCKDSWIEFSYLDQPDIDYAEILNKFKKQEQWETDPQRQYRSKKIYL